MPHLLEQIRERAAAGERVLVTTLTKRLAEDLSAYFSEQGVRCKWLHSELDAFERVELLRDLRKGEFDVLVGVNLAARRARPAGGFAGGDSRCRQGRLFAERDVADADDRPRGPKRECQGDSLRRHGDRLDAARDRRNPPPPDDAASVQRRARHHARDDQEGDPRRHRVRGRRPRRANAAVGRTDEAQYITEEYISELEAEMFAAAEALEFERAAAIRDRITKLRDSIGKQVGEVDFKADTNGNGKRRRRGGRLPRPKKLG